MPDAAAAAGVSQVQPLKELERKTSAKEALSPRFSRDLPVRHTPKKLWEVRVSSQFALGTSAVRQTCLGGKCVRRRKAAGQLFALACMDRRNTAS